MVSSALALMLAAATAQASDTTRESREVFATCLRGFVENSLQAQKSAEEFEAEYPQACATQEAAFRAAIIRRDTAARFSRADAEEAAGLEIEDARFNFSERFEMAMPADPPPQQQAAQQATPAEQAQGTEQAQATDQPPSR